MATGVLPLVIGIGGMLVSSLFGPKKKTQYGQRTPDTNIPTVNPGNTIPRVWGMMKIPTQLVWTSKLIETMHVEKVGGGKGGAMGGKSQKQVTYTYSVDCAQAICLGPILKVLRIRANQKPIWLNPEVAPAVDPASYGLIQGKYFQRAAVAGWSSTVINQDIYFDAAFEAEFERLHEEEGLPTTDSMVSAYFFAFNNYSMQEYTPATQGSAQTYCVQQFNANPVKYAGFDGNRMFYLFSVQLSQFDRDKYYSTFKLRYASMNIYLGDETQAPNPIMESYIGVGKVPAHRGVAYFVVQGLQLEDFGNTIPTMSADVVMQDGSAKLIDIVEDLCLEGGMDPYNINALGRIDERIDVKGYAIMQPHSARECIEDLMKVYPFDAWETGFEVKFGMVNKRPTAILRRGDFGARLDKDEPPDSLNIVRKHDYDMPARINFKYQEPARAFSTNTVSASRQTGEADMVDDIDVSIGMERTEAKSRVEEYMLNRYLQRREYTVQLPRRYAILEPGDTVLVPEENETWQFLELRITETNIGANGLINVKMEDAFFHGPSVAITEDNIEDAGLEQLPPTGSRTYAYMLDLPVLQDIDPQGTAGFYAILAGSKGGWSGGNLLVDINSNSTIPVPGGSIPAPNAGAEWYAIAEGRQSTVHGFATKTLRTDVDEFGWDHLSEVYLFTIDKSYEPASATKADVLANAINVAVIGNEVVQFCDVEDKGQGNFILRTFLRGRRGTEWAIKDHVDSDRFIRLDQGNIQFIPHDVSAIGQSARFKTTSANVDITGDDDAFNFTDTGNYLRPWAPSVRRAQRIDAADYVIEWLPRVRRGGAWNNDVETQLDQPFERYEIDVVQNGNVLRTASISDLRTWTYTAAQQTADFGGPVSSITLRLYQIGETIGRGFAREIAA